MGRKKNVVNDVMVATCVKIQENTQVYIHDVIILDTKIMKRKKLMMKSADALPEKGAEPPFMSVPILRTP